MLSQRLHQNFSTEFEHSAVVWSYFTSA